jgi:branched-chain amino acid transport system permease protein
LCAAVFGVTSITGAALGGTALMLLPVLQSDHPSIAGLMFMVLAVGAILLAKDPNGLANQLFKLGRSLERRIAPSIRANLPTLPCPGAGPDDELADEPEGVPARAY